MARTRPERARDGEITPAMERVAERENRAPDFVRRHVADGQAVATEITECVEIRLEHEVHYDWVAFVPQRESDTGALTKYFGNALP